MKTAILIAIFMLCVGCSSLTGSKETKEFDLPGSGGYSGEPVGSCSQRSADGVCRDLGWDGATDWSCGAVHVCGGFFGCFDQDVMYTVTCYRD